MEELQAGLDTIHRRASGLSVFLDAYTNLYRTPEFNPESSLVLPLLERLADLFRDQVEMQDTGLSFDCADPKLQVLMDVRMIEQVMINLIKNAMEAVKGQSTRSIALSAVQTRKEILISVKDTGTGIPKDEMESIFMPFFSTKENGTGVGLSFSQHVMRLHKGFVRVTSSPGEGSTFFLVFPNP
jgi:two-component system nitrogen regulation sensor histidine kinase NtrY